MRLPAASTFHKLHILGSQTSQGNPTQFLPFLYTQFFANHKILKLTSCLRVITQQPHICSPYKQQISYKLQQQNKEPQQSNTTLTMNAAAQGDQAVSNSDWLSAIQHYTQALVELPRAPIYYTKRSTAYSRVKPADGGPKSSSALNDAEIALTLARERGKRELILAAQMRRGVALYQLGQYGDANFVFETIEKKVGSAGGQNKDKSEQVRAAMGSGSTSRYEQELPIWTAKVKGQLKKLGEEDAKAKVSVEEYPTGVQVPTENNLKEQLAQIKAGKLETEQKQPQSTDKSTAQDTKSASAASSTTTPAAAPAAPAPVNVRHEWYQSNDSVVVTLYAKGIAKDKVDSDLKNDSVC